jgi:hypothetical protein
MASGLADDSRFIRDGWSTENSLSGTSLAATVYVRQFLQTVRRASSGREASSQVLMSSSLSSFDIHLQYHNNLCVRQTAARTKFGN